MKVLSTLFLSLMVFILSVGHAAVNLEKIKLPPDFLISLYAKDLKGARSLTWGDKRTLFVGTRNEGKVLVERGVIHLRQSED